MKPCPRCPNDWMNFWERWVSVAADKLFWLLANAELQPLAQQFDHWKLVHVTAPLRQLSSWAMKRGEDREKTKWTNRRARELERRFGS